MARENALEWGETGYIDQVMPGFIKTCGVVRNWFLPPDEEVRRICQLSGRNPDIPPPWLQKPVPIVRIKEELPGPGKYCHTIMMLCRKCSEFKLAAIWDEGDTIVKDRAVRIEFQGFVWRCPRGERDPEKPWVIQPAQDYMIWVAQCSKCRTVYYGRTKL